MEEHIKTLKKLAALNEPIKIDQTTDYNFSVIEDLLNLQYIESVVSRPISTPPTYFNVKITLLGRTWLSDIQSSDSSLDIVELKPNIMGFGINLNALYRWLKRKKI
ncbi:hypothetical protein ACFOEE_12405 [Pseudoalteromonas fenneropenaei]|uniref:DUF2513 domain-containing protein n=1 Tax=Pseudoalteromonas fenneropenaei TaxID=1737459 RepID=A0ABV7CLE3_9GAMM